MAAKFEGKLQYSILDPTGNITALVENFVVTEDQAAAAAEIMRRHPDVEQVGFVQFPEPGEAGQPDAVLRMAGGEFCGNASMCTAYLTRMHRRNGDAGKSMKLSLQVSGASLPVEVVLEAEENGSTMAEILMPGALGIEERGFTYGELEGRLPVVYLEGISHIIIENDSVFSCLIEDREAAGRAVRTWCRELKAEGLGLMFLGRDTEDRTLTPLVYIPGSDTIFWENSCASGTSAAGMYLAMRSGSSVSEAVREPGGTLTVKSDPASGRTVLSGRVRMRGKYRI